MCAYACAHRSESAEDRRLRRDSALVRDHHRLGPIGVATRRAGGPHDPRLREDGEELHQLARGQMLAPPRVDTNRRAKVVRVHEHVNE